MAENLMDGLLSEMNRVSDLITHYQHPSLKGSGNITAALMRIDIQAAEKSISSGDVIEMLRCYSVLKEYEG